LGAKCRGQGAELKTATKRIFFFGSAGASPSEISRRARLWRAEFPFVGQGFILCRRIFYRRGVKPRPTLSPISLVGQGFTPCRQILSARCKTAPYIEPIFIPVGQEPDPPKQRIFGSAGASPSQFNFALRTCFGSAGVSPPKSLLWLTVSGLKTKGLQDTLNFADKKFGMLAFA